MLELKNIIYKKDNKTILNKINLKINSSGIIAITGPNGGGKSTLAKLIMGIIKPTSGKIYFNNQEITNLKIEERASLGIGLCFQTPIRFQGIKVKDFLQFSSQKKLNNQDIAQVFNQIKLCPKSYLNRYLDKNLSGGEIKKVEIASVLLRQNSLNLFDEPETGIDLWSFDTLINTFINLKNNQKSLNLIITHQEKILKIADQIFIIENGQISQISKNNLSKLTNQPIQSCQQCLDA